MTIPTLPSAPLVTDIPADFNTKAFNWVAALDNWTTEANATGVAADADAATATSAAGTATTQAGTATTQAGIATSAASTATTQAGIATTKAGEANASAVAAAASAASINLNSIDINGGTIDGTVIGGTTPAAVSATTLSASGDIMQLASGGRLTFSTTTGNGGVQNNNGTAYLLTYGSTHATEASNVWINSTGGSVKVKYSGADVGVFSSTGLAVTGALSATEDAVVGGTAAFSANDRLTIRKDSDARNGVAISNQNPGTSATARLTLGAYGNDWIIENGSYAKNGNSLTIGIIAGTLATLDTSGNLGLGVTPSAWGGSSRKALQFVGSGAIEGSASVGLTLSNNMYYNGTNDIYTANGAAYKHEIGTGFVWKTAPSGTAGNAITFTQSLAVGLGTTLALEGATSAAGTGIAFPATQVASSNANTLDDYEEGTWTPTQGAGLTVVGAFSSSGTYTKVGRQVSVHGSVAGATSIVAASGGIMCGGLPFTVGGGAVGGASDAAIAISAAIVGSGTSLFCTGVTSTTIIYFTATYHV